MAAQKITRTAESTDRTPALSATRTGNPTQSKTTARVGVARRILSALMRSLATPHV